MSYVTYIRVRYSETDKFGVVYFGRYFTYFEVARAEMFRSRGKSYRELEESGMFFVVAEACCKYVKPAHYDDLLRIETSIERIGSKSIVFRHQIYRDSELIAEGREVLVSVDKSGKPVPIPSEIYRLLGVKRR